MDKITNALKCVNCRSILVSPVFLPCHHSVCKHHALTGSKSPIKCGECGRNHEIPTNGFEDNKPLADIISTQVHSIHLGEAHENAKKDYVSYQSLISRVNDHLADLSLETYEKINEMKNEVLLKREELKQEIDQESEKLIVKLDDYLEIFRNHLNDERVQLLESELEEKIKEATVQLKDFQNRLDLMNADEKSWTATSIEINRRKRILSECLDRLNNSLVVKSDMQELETQMGYFKCSSFKYQKRFLIFILFFPFISNLKYLQKVREQLKMCHLRRWEIIR